MNATEPLVRLGRGWGRRPGRTSACVSGESTLLTSTWRCCQLLARMHGRVLCQSLRPLAADVDDDLGIRDVLCASPRERAGVAITQPSNYGQVARDDNAQADQEDGIAECSQQN